MRIEFDRVCFRYGNGGPWLIDSLSFEAGSGAVIGFVGPSGCGKSTVLDLIGGLRRPQSGEISWIDVEPEAAEQASWVIQSNPVLAGRSALDNVAVSLVAQGYRMRDSRRRARGILAELGLGSRADAAVGDLSGGEVQRVTIARSLLAKFPVIIADEPTGQLDAASTALVYQALRSAADSNKLVFVATHDPWLADRCDEQISLRSGGEYAVDPPR